MARQRVDGEQCGDGLVQSRAQYGALVAAAVFVVPGHLAVAPGGCPPYRQSMMRRKNSMKSQRIAAAFALGCMALVVVAMPSSAATDHGSQNHTAQYHPDH